MLSSCRRPEARPAPPRALQLPPKDPTAARLRIDVESLLPRRGPGLHPQCSPLVEGGKPRRPRFPPPVARGRAPPQTRAGPRKPRRLGTTARAIADGPLQNATANAASLPSGAAVPRIRAPVAVLKQTPGAPSAIRRARARAGLSAQPQLRRSEPAPLRRRQDTAIRAPLFWIARSWRSEERRVGKECRSGG